MVLLTPIPKNAMMETITVAMAAAKLARLKSLIGNAKELSLRNTLSAIKKVVMASGILMKNVMMEI